jgi:hypothetical protein
MVNTPPAGEGVAAASADGVVTGSERSKGVWQSHRSGNGSEPGAVATGFLNFFPAMSDRKKHFVPERNAHSIND